MFQVMVPKMASISVRYHAFVSFWDYIIDSWTSVYWSDSNLVESCGVEAYVDGTIWLWDYHKTVIPFSCFVNS